MVGEGAGLPPHFFARFVTECYSQFYKNKTDIICESRVEGGPRGGWLGFLFTGRADGFVFKAVLLGLDVSFGGRIHAWAHPWGARGLSNPPASPLTSSLPVLPPRPPVCNIVFWMCLFSQNTVDLEPSSLE